MKRKVIPIGIALVITIVFLAFAIRPGIFNMIGYTISLLILPENSPESLKYGKIIIYSFDVFCGVLLFWIVYKILSRISK
jgi:hypothetical protein